MTTILSSSYHHSHTHTHTHTKEDMMQQEAVIGHEKEEPIVRHRP